jgi:hypothetical protein
MDLRPCGCGEVRFERASSVIVLDDGDLASRYGGTCTRCGSPREFVFRLPPEIMPPPAGGQVRYGGPEPSELIDAGEWLWVADSYARAVPASLAGLTEVEQRRARARLATALAAMEEVLKFAPSEATEVPPTAVWTTLGRSVYEREPGRFQVARLAAVRSVYADSLRRMS